jgi:hypothetical protein
MMLSRLIRGENVRNDLGCHVFSKSRTTCLHGLSHNGPP